MSTTTRSCLVCSTLNCNNILSSAPAPLHSTLGIIYRFNSVAKYTQSGTDNDDDWMEQNYDAFNETHTFNGHINFMAWSSTVPGDLRLILESNFQRNYSAQCAQSLSTKLKLIDNNLSSEFNPFRAGGCGQLFVLSHSLCTNELITKLSTTSIKLTEWKTLIFHTLNFAPLPTYRR